MMPRRENRSLDGEVLVWHTGHCRCDSLLRHRLTLAARPPEVVRRRPPASSR